MKMLRLRDDCQSERALRPVLERRLMHMQSVLSEGTVVMAATRKLVKRMHVEKARFDRVLLHYRTRWSCCESLAE